MSGQTAFDKLVRSAALCRGEKSENIKLEEMKETGLNGVEEGEGGMSDGEGDRIDGEEELAPPDWRARAGPRNRPTQKERDKHEATHVPFRDWCAHCMMSRGRTHHHVTKRKSEDQSRRPTIATDYYFIKNEVHCECSNNVRRSSNPHRGEEDRHQNIMSCCVEQRS